MKTYNLFISHSWSYSSQYDRLVNLLNKRSYFSFKNYSVPPDNPIHRAGTNAQLRQAIRNHMRPCHVVLILAGVYATYSKWIDREIDLALHGFANAKPIIAIRPWGNERVSVPVSVAADRIVGWNTRERGRGNPGSGMTAGSEQDRLLEIYRLPRGTRRPCEPETGQREPPVRESAYSFGGIPWYTSTIWAWRCP